MIDLSEVIESESEPVVWKSRVGGSFNDTGDWVGEAFVLSTVLAAVQPARAGEVLKDERNGEVIEVTYNAWTRANVKVDDLITFGGADYRVIGRHPRAEGGFNRLALGLIR